MRSIRERVVKHWQICEKRTDGEGPREFKGKTAKNPRKEREKKPGEIKTDGGNTPLGGGNARKKSGV